MKKLNKLLLLITAALFTLTLSACKSNKVQEEAAPETEEEKFKKYDDAMFWEINGTTEDGRDSTVYILGTYHIGDDRLYPVPEYIEAAWQNSDRLVAELSLDDWKNFQEQVDEKTMDSIIINSGRTLVDELTPKELTVAAEYLGEEDIAAAICYEPWVLNSLLSTKLIYLSDLKPELSYDVTLINLAINEGRNFEGLDELKVQVDLNAYGDWNTQMLLLRDTLDSLKDKDSAMEELSSTYDAYLSHDESVLSDLYFADIEKDITENPELATYFDDLLYNRNRRWAKKIAAYLKEEGKTFIFAGAAHFIGQDSVFDYMKRNGDLD